MSMRHYLTTKQSQILAVIAGKNEDGSLVDLDQLLDRLPYETTKQSIHFSLRALIARKFLKKAGEEKRRGRRRRLIDLGDAGLALYGAALKEAGVGAAFAVDEITDGAERALEEPSY